MISASIVQLLFAEAIVSAATHPTFAFTSISTACQTRQRRSHNIEKHRFFLSAEASSNENDNADAALEGDHEETNSISMAPNDGTDTNDDFASTSTIYTPATTSRRKRFRQKVSHLAKTIVVKPIASAAPMPKKIAELLKDATVGAVEEASSSLDSMMHTSYNIQELVEDAFAPMETSLDEMELALQHARSKLKLAKLQAKQAMQTAIQDAAEEVMTEIMLEEEKVVEEESGETPVLSNDDIAALTYEEVDYFQSEMAPPFLDSNQCLVPGEAAVRVEKAPLNSRRIFAGIDIPVSVDTIWSLLTDYPNLQKVVPNLAVNQVLQEFEASSTTIKGDSISPSSVEEEEQQCEIISKQLKGSILRQVGNAKVAGINFSARTTLEVREWPQGLPESSMHFEQESYGGKSRNARAMDNAQIRLQRYRFPRPFSVSSLPTKDITMQSLEKDNGEFRLYQGVWRMQPLPGCAPPGQQAMRLTYAVEVSPRAYLPVSLVEGRIVKDLCSNLEAIRDYVMKAEEKQQNVVDSVENQNAVTITGA